LYASPEQLSALSSAAETLPLSDKMDTYCLAATLLLALVGPTYFPGEGADSRLEIVKAQNLRATSPLAKGALIEASGAPRKMLAAAFCRWMNPDPLDRPPVRVMADELDVLLEPERDQARRRARRSVQLRYAARMAIATLLMAAAGGAFFAYSKRETLRLASELDRARAEGAASFAGLDTCIASHQLAQREAASCRDANSQLETRYRTKLRQVTKSGNASEAAFAKQLQSLETTYTSRLKSCEDDRWAAARAREVEKEQLSRDWQHQETQLTTERDEQRKLADLRSRDLDRCRADLASRGHAAEGEHTGAGEALEGPSSVGETPLPGPVGPAKRRSPPVLDTPPTGPAPIEGARKIRLPPVESDSLAPSTPSDLPSPSPAAANW
jgi:hypothetical protein